MIAPDGIVPGATAAGPTGVYLDQVRWSDVDAAGIVCYGRYLRFFEGAEEALFRALDLAPEALPRDHGVWLVRRRVTAEFSAPARLGDMLETRAGITHVGESSVCLAFTVSSHGATVAEGEYVLVCVDRDTLQREPLPEGVAHRLAVVSATTDRAGALASVAGSPELPR
jgi:YbgC/YbaW family acyl-CoA thioester hydrolase